MKKSIYNIMVRDGEYVIILNTLSGKFVKVYDPNAIVPMILKNEIVYSNEFIEKINLLKNYHFLVEDNIDEKQMWQQSILNYIENTKVLNLVILPTETCNFRCQYCYESHVGKTMNITMAKKVIDFAIKMSEGKECINVSWFGGEPLISYDIIEYVSNGIMEFAKKHRIKYISSMTTNGYLLTCDMVARLKKLNVYEYQITIDGFASSHDRSRISEYGNGTWNTIISNLLSIKENCHSALLRFIIRTNVNSLNIAEISEFMEFLQEKFGDDRRFEILVRPVSDWGNMSSYIKETILSTEEYYNILLNTLNYKMKNVAVHMSITPFGLLCHAWKNNTYVIDPEGNLKKCTVLLTNKINNIGKLEERNIDSTNWKFFSQKIPLKCEQCNKYPICCKVRCHLEESEECDVIVKNLETILPIIATERYGCVIYD